MTALYIIGGIVAFFVLVGLIPAGVDASYRNDVFTAAVRVWLFSVRLGGEKKPKKEKKKKPKKEEKEPKPKKKRKLPPLSVIKSAAGRVMALLGRLVSSLRTELLRLHFTAASPDPADAAETYCAAGLAMDTLLHLGEGRIQKADLLANVDFDREKPVIDFRIIITIRIGRLVHEVFRLAFGVLGDFLKYKIQSV